MEAARREVVAYYIEGAGARGDKLFGEYAIEWYRIHKEPLIAASTRASYRSMFNKFLLPAFGNRHLKALRTSDLQAWLNGFAGMSKSQIELAIGALHGIFRMAMAERLIPADPTVALAAPKHAAAKQKRALTPSEREKMVSVMRTHQHGAYLAVLYYTGVRPGETRGLQWGDIDWQDGVIHIVRDIDYADHASAGALKTEASKRDVPLVEDLRSILIAGQGKNPSEYIFHGREGKPISLATSERWWIELMIACDMADPTEFNTYKNGDIRGAYKPRITQNALRHNFASMCWEHGLDAAVTKNLVGHTDIRTTLNVYTHLSRIHLADARKQLDDMFAGQSCTKVAQTSTDGKSSIKQNP